jgi:hypothetical protein
MQEHDNFENIISSNEEIPFGKKKFETRVRVHGNGSVEKEIWIDNQLLDWSIDISSYMEARKMGDKYQNAIKRDIAEHFTNAVSDLVGRKVTMQEILQATKIGYI